MTQEEKQLLLKDLSARLPYGVKIDREWIAPMTGSLEHYTMEFNTFDIEIIKTSIELGEEGNYRDGRMTGLTHCDDGKAHFVRGYMCKPYLRSMSTMTDDEEAELKRLGITNVGSEELFSWATEARYFDFWVTAVDWLNSHHFDYRGLIKRGLALEAPEDMYKED